MDSQGAYKLANVGTLTCPRKPHPLQKWIAYTQLGGEDFSTVHPRLEPDEFEWKIGVVSPG